MFVNYITTYIHKYSCVCIQTKPETKNEKLKFNQDIHFRHNVAGKFSSR